MCREPLPRKSAGSHFEELRKGSTEVAQVLLHSCQVAGAPCSVNFGQAALSCESYLEGLREGSVELARVLLHSCQGAGAFCSLGLSHLAL